MLIGKSQGFSDTVELDRYYIMSESESRIKLTPTISMTALKEHRM